MTTFRLLSFSAAAVLAMAGITASGAEVEFSYSYGSKDIMLFGTKKAETYDIAIRLADPSLVGAKIKTFSVPFVESENISDISVWVTKELRLEEKVNVPDITSVEAVCSENEVNVTFPEMIEIPEGGVYVGYSFTVTAKAEDAYYPIALAGEAVEDGLYLHTSRTYLKWKSYAEATGYSSAITVGLDGDFYANAVGVKSVKDPFGTPGTDLSIYATLVNHGNEPIESIEYTVKNADESQTNVLKFDQAQSLMFGQPFNVELPYTAPEEVNNYPITVTVNKVNGAENMDNSNSGEALLLVLSDMPVHKPLMEEYTGLWCGWCPRGFAALEAMNKRHPEDFVAISYHNGDDMERTTSFPSPVAGFPSAYMDRVSEIDAYYGVSNDGFGIETLWQSVSEEFTPVVVKGSASFTENGSIDVKSDISFVRPMDGSYKVGYAIVANGLSDEKWSQSNYYSGSDSSGLIPEMEKFCNGGGSVEGLVFDDVFAAGSNLHGEPDSEINNVEQDKVYSHKYNFAADAGVSLTNYDMFKGAKSLYAVIFVLDENGAVLNCNKVPVEVYDPLSVGSISAEKTVKTEYFDLSGRRVAEPSCGIYIKVDTKENGGKVSSKVVVRK